MAPDPDKRIAIRGARGNNLKDVDVDIPLGRFVCVTGVSGSGKSTLVNDTLHAPPHAISTAAAGTRAARQHRGAGGDRQGHQRRPEPIGRTPRSNPATYTGAVRSRSATCSRQCRGARARLRPGTLLVQRQGRPLRGLPGRRRDQGRDALPARRLRALRRVPRQALQPRDAGGPLQGQDVAEVLGLTVDEARDIFSAVPPLARKLRRWPRWAWATSRSARARRRSRAARRSA
jgi:excinuclease ABC subunit A